MAIDKLGIRVPAEINNVLADENFFTDNGMFYEYFVEAGIMSAEHEDVGLATYYRVDLPTWQTFRDGVA